MGKSGGQQRPSKESSRTSLKSTIALNKMDAFKGQLVMIADARPVSLKSCLKRSDSCFPAMRDESDHSERWSQAAATTKAIRPSRSSANLDLEGVATRRESRRLNRRMRRRQQRVSDSAIISTTDNTNTANKMPIKGILKRCSSYTSINVKEEEERSATTKGLPPKCASLGCTGKNNIKSISFLDMKLCRWNSQGSLSPKKEQSQKAVYCPTAAAAVTNESWDSSVTAATTKRQAKRVVSVDSAKHELKMAGKFQAPAKPRRRRSANEKGNNVFQASIQEFQAAYHLDHSGGSQGS